MTALRATLRPLRTELRAVVGLTALLVLAAVGVTLRLLALGIPAECFDAGSTAPICLGRQFDVMEYQSFAEKWGGAVGISAAVMPAIVGMFLGIAAVCKELDQRTSVLAWSVDASRRHWLAQRVFPLVGIVALLGLGGAQLLMLMYRLRAPGIDPATYLGFETMPFVGLAPAAIGIFAFGIAIFVGAILGRLLPAVLAGAALVLLAAVLIQQGNEHFMATETVISEGQVPGRYIDSFPMTTDGRIISWEEAYSLYADPTTGEMGPGVRQMTIYVPIEVLPEIAARYALLHLMVGLMALTLTFAVVERRSP